MKSPSGAQVDIFESIEAMAEAFAGELSARVRATVAAEGAFSLALTGGRTPEPLYRRLGEPAHATAAPWERVKVFWGDERAVGPEDPASNFRLAWQAWLAHGPVPRERIYRMEGEAEDLHAAAERYSMLLNAHLPSGPSGFPQFDLILLGLGPDGHVASLFPDTAALRETLRVAVANEVPRLETWRLTLTFPVLNEAREVWFLVSGADKAQVVYECLGYGPLGGATHPATLVHTAGGRVRWWLDAPAAAKLPHE